jgi:hypothetical protein
MAFQNLTRTFGRNPIMNVDKDKFRNIMANKAENNTEINNPIFDNMSMILNQCLGKNKK